MNKQRRAEIAKLRQRIDELQGLVSELSQDVQAIAEEEQEAFDNLPEALQAGEKGETMQNAINSLEEVYGDLDSFGEQCADLGDKLEEAAA